MKVIVSSSGETLEAPIDPRFGRAAKLIVYDLATDELEAVDNEANANLPQGAGIQTAALAAELGAGCVITGHCGPKAFKALEAAGVEVVVDVEGTVREAIEKYRAGLLASASGPNVEGPWK